VQFHPDPKRLLLVTGSDDGATKVWSLTDKSCLATLGQHMSAVTCVSFSGSGGIMATGSRDKVVNFWETEDFSLLKTLPVYEEVEGLTILDPKGDDERHDAQSAADQDSDAVATTSTKKRKVPSKIDASSPGCLVVVGSQGLARSWHLESVDSASKEKRLQCKLQATQPSRKGPAGTPYMALATMATMTTTALSGGGGPLLVAATADHNLVFLDPLTLAPQRQIVGYNDEVSAVKYVGSSSDGVTSDVVAVATNSPLLKLLRIKDMSCDVLEGHSASILSVDACPTGKYLATGSKDRTVRVWEIASGECVMVCVGHTQPVGAVGFARKALSYDAGSAFVFSGSEDRTLKRWRVDPRKFRTGNDEAWAPLQPTSELNVRAHEKDINHICVAPNDALVATSSQVGNKIYQSACVCF
jgi:U3 small nucleolar RNA-associated protein 13